MYDYAIVGGGLAGCVLANRLQQYQPTAKIILIEAGQDTRDRSDVQNPQALNLGGELDWQYQSDPMPALGGRSVTLNSGKGLGGSSAINSGTRKRSQTGA
jgi:choline dehydrogenase-like flavoprotein